MRDLAINSLELEMIASEIRRVPNIRAKVHFRGEEMSVAKVKKRLIELLPQTFHFKEILFKGMGDQRFANEILRLALASGRQEALDSYKESLQKLHDYVTQSESSSLVNPGDNERFLREGQRFARRVQSSEEIINFGKKLNLLIDRVVSSKETLLLSLNPDKSSSVKTALINLSRESELIETLKEVMSEYAELQAQLLFTLNKERKV